MNSIEIFSVDQELQFEDRVGIITAIGTDSVTLLFLDGEEVVPCERLVPKPSCDELDTKDDLQEGLLHPQGDFVELSNKPLDLEKSYPAERESTLTVSLEPLVS